MMTADQTPLSAKVGPPAYAPATVRDVLSWPGFDVDLVAGAPGADRVIRLAHATELVDPSDFLRGGELIMTVGSELRDRPACERFVANLMATDAAGIALATGVSGHATPPWLAEVADAVGLPVLEVPPHLPFVAFTEHLQRLREERQDHERQRNEDGRMLDHVRRGYASPQVFRDRFSLEPSVRYGALCLPSHLTAEVGGVVVEGWVDGVTLVVALDPYLETFAETTTTTIFGIGGPGPFASLARILKEAVAACSLSMRRGRSAGPRDLASLSGLVERLTPDQLAPFEDHVLRPLQQFDMRHDRALVHTLVTYLDTGRSVAATARRLSLHANSVRNRLAKIADLTGLDPHDSDDHVALTISVHGLRSSEPQQRRV